MYTHVHEYDRLVEGNVWQERRFIQASWGLVDIYKGLGDNIIGVEVGVCSGLNSTMLMLECPNIKKLYGVDPYAAYQDWNRYFDQNEQDSWMETARKNLKDWPDRFEFVRKTSEDAASMWADGSLDFVFIDGDHSYDGARKDFELYIPKVRSGGIISGHDFNITDVRNALQNWFDTNNKDMAVLQSVENTSWYWIKE